MPEAPKITPEMIKAGADAIETLLGSEQRYLLEEIVAQAFGAMWIIANGSACGNDCRM